jgi:hypothetical protein
MNTSSEGTEADWADKTNIARESFKEVLASDEHEDGKAQRILTAMAFLTAAAGFIFAELIRVGTGAALKFPIFTSYAYIPLCFFAFVVTIIIGTLLFLAALGPAFNIPKAWRKKEKTSYPQSLLFSQAILQGTQTDWENHWRKSSVEKLQDELAKNYVTEAYLLAGKVKFKVSSMRWGKIVYKFSLGFLGMLVMPLLTTNAGQLNSLAAWVFAAVFIEDTLERVLSPGGSILSTDNLAVNLVELGLGIFLIIWGITNWVG